MNVPEREIDKMVFADTYVTPIDADTVQWMTDKGYGPIALLWFHMVSYADVGLSDELFMSVLGKHLN